MKRKNEEDDARQSAGLTVFKSTGNAMRDGFRRMIEKKMKEKIQSELEKKQQEDSTFNKEVQLRTAQREKQMEDEKKKLIEEHEIKLKTAQEARHDAEVMAKKNTVGAMVEAAQ